MNVTERETSQNVRRTCTAFADQTYCFVLFSPKAAVADARTLISNYLLGIRSDAANKEWLCLLQDFHETIERRLRK